jgi:MarR family transcriptional regulator, organic hydroperoxide resistance regulator
MFDYNEISDLLFENLKKVFFPEEWLRLDMKFSKSEIFTMLLIDKRKEITMTELAEFIHSPMSTATGIIDRLVKNGYIKRDRSEQDRRIVVLMLAEKGAQEITRLKNLISEYAGRVAEGLTQEEMQVLTGIVRKVIRVLNTEFTEGPNEKEEGNAVQKIEI